VEQRICGDSSIELRWLDYSLTAFRADGLVAPEIWPGLQLSRPSIAGNAVNPPPLSDTKMQIWEVSNVLPALSRTVSSKPE
jgi:hypothetical protein